MSAGTFLVGLGIAGVGVVGAWLLLREEGGSPSGRPRASSQRFTPSFAVLGYREGGGPAKSVEWGFNEIQAHQIANAKTLGDNDRVYRVVHVRSKEELTERADRAMSREEYRRLFDAKKRRTARWKQKAKREFAKYR